MDISTENERQAAFWESAAPSWRDQPDIDAQLDPYGLAAIDAIAPATGERIVDIGCGTGVSLVQLAERVGPTGRVQGLDVSEAMLEAARVRLNGLGESRVSLTVGDATTMKFDGTADVVYSRFGVMFFGDPLASFENILTALHPGGRLGFVCWQSAAGNPWVSTPLQLMAELIDLPLSDDPDDPGPFAFADADRVEGILRDAGFYDVEIAGHERRLNMGPDVSAAVDFICGITPLAAQVERDDPDRFHRLRLALEGALAPYASDQGITPPSAAWVITARPRIKRHGYDSSVMIG